MGRTSAGGGIGAEPDGADRNDDIDSVRVKCARPMHSSRSWTHSTRRCSTTPTGRTPPRSSRRPAGRGANFLTFEDGFPAERHPVLLREDLHSRGKTAHHGWKSTFGPTTPWTNASRDGRQLPDSKIVHIANLFNEEERRTSIAYNEAAPRFEYENGLNVRLGRSRRFTHPSGEWGTPSTRAAGPPPGSTWSRGFFPTCASTFGCAPHWWMRAHSARPPPNSSPTPAPESSSPRPARADCGGQRRRAGGCFAETTGCATRTKSCTPPGRTTTTGSRRCWPERCRTGSNRA